MEQLTTILQEATAAIPREYFLLPIHGADPVYRERVYCYELYHQLRLRWPPDSRWCLNGEVDKQAHPYFQDGGAPKPDLLVHEPGTGNNCAVIEVKPCHAGLAGIRKDVTTLSTFVNNFGYRRAIYLIFGTDAEDILPRIHRSAEGLQGLIPIELWLHRDSGMPAEQVGWDA